MSVIQAITTSFKAQMMEGVHDLRVGGDVFKLALYGPSANLNSSTTAYTAEGEISASGYSPGGITLTNLGVSTMGQTAMASFADLSISMGSSSVVGALIYNTTPAHTYTNPSVMVLSFGMTRNATNGVFAITFPPVNSQNAIIRNS
jgi:hypothetical protein